MIGPEWPAECAPTLDTTFGDKMGLDDQHVGGGADCSFPQVAMCLTRGAMQRLDAETETLIPTHGGGFDDGPTHSLRGEGFDASEDDTGRGTPLVPVAIQERAVSENPEAGPQGKGWQEDCAFTLEARSTVQAVAFDTTQVTSPANYSAPKPGDACHPLAAGAHPPAIAFSAKDYGADALDDCSPTLRAGGHAGSHANAGVMPAIASQSAVRRLTPRECERLQGFPDDWTAIPWRGKPADQCPDGPRYKALGNSMAVPVMRWIGERIDYVDSLSGPQAPADASASLAIGAGAPARGRACGDAGRIAGVPDSEGSRPVADQATARPSGRPQAPRSEAEGTAPRTKPADAGAEGQK